MRPPVGLGAARCCRAPFADRAQPALGAEPTINAYDINEPLIYVYKNIQTQHTEVYAILQTIIGELNACPSEGTLNRKPATIEDAM